MISIVLMKLMKMKLVLIFLDFMSKLVVCTLCFKSSLFFLECKYSILAKFDAPFVLTL